VLESTLTVPARRTTPSPTSDKSVASYRSHMLHGGARDLNISLLAQLLANRDCRNAHRSVNFQEPCFIRRGKLKLTNMLITVIGIRLETDVPYTQRICIRVSDLRQGYDQ
jgi:hypothetical protein